MNLRSLNSLSMQGASFDREIASGFARKAISQDGEAVRSDSSAVAVDDAQVARTTSAPVVLRVGDSPRWGWRHSAFRRDLGPICFANR